MKMLIEVDTEKRTARIVSGGKASPVSTTARAAGRLSKDDHKELRGMIMKGIVVAQIAEKFGVSEPYIYIIRQKMRKEGMKVPIVEHKNKTPWRTNGGGFTRRPKRDNIPADDEIGGSLPDEDDILG